MLTMYVSLPGEMKEFVENQVNSGRYNSVSEYIRELIRKDEKDRAQERLEPMLLAGTESGSPTALTPENWNEIRQEARKPFSERKARNGG